jgi:hypothetical protein
MVLSLPMSTDSLKGREIYIEFFRIGGSVKVTAMDTATLTEISVQGPPSAGEEALKRNALNRLEYVMRKKKLID